VEDPAGRAYEEERARLPCDVPVTLVFNKCDLVPGLPVPDTLSGPPWVMLSALTGAGFDELTQHLKTCMGYQMAEGGAISARARHVEALTRARRHTEQAARVLAERRAGELAAEDLLGRIFAGFCIGK
jgi:tRNA modification GTPase